HATYTRKKIVTIDENGEPHEEIVENFEGDEDLHGKMNFNFNHNMDSALDSQQWQALTFDTLIDPQVFYFNSWPQDFDFQLHFPDSFPPLPPPHVNVDEFREEFETMFRENFSDFYEDHAQDLQTMMDDLEKKFQHFNEDTTWQRELRRSMREVERNMKRLHENMEKARENHDDEMLQRQKAMEERQDRMEAVQQKMQANQQDLARARAKMETARVKMQEQRQKQKSAMENLQKQLVKDGYLKKGEIGRAHV